MKTSFNIILVYLVAALGAFCEVDKKDWDANVLRLFSIEQRDEALQKILTDAHYPKNPRYIEKPFKPNVRKRIAYVVVCPQHNTRPIVGVFFGGGNKHGSQQSGHFILIRSDGMIIPFYKGVNHLDGLFVDVNNDRITDFVDAWDVQYEDDRGLVTELHVVPIQENFKASLIIHWKKDALTWRFHRSPNTQPVIQIGRAVKGGFEVVAEYKWSHQDGFWMGPQGGGKKGFNVVRGGNPKLANR